MTKRTYAFVPMPSKRPKTTPGTPPSPTCHCSGIIAELKELVAELREANRNIGERLSNIERKISGSGAVATNVSTSAVNSDFENSVIQYGRVQREYNYRNARRVNLLIFGLPDSGVDPPDDKRSDPDSNDDLKLIRGALDSIQGLEPISILSASRLGSFDSSSPDAKSRPLKAVFDTVQSKSNVMKHLKQFIQNLNLPNIFVRNDLTTFQRQQRKSTLDVLHKIRAELPDDQKKCYVLREFNGSAKIVQRQQSDQNQRPTFADVYVAGSFCSPYNVQFDNLTI